MCFLRWTWKIMYTYVKNFQSMRRRLRFIKNLQRLWRLVKKVIWMSIPRRDCFRSWVQGRRLLTGNLRKGNLLISRRSVNDVAIFWKNIILLRGMVWGVTQRRVCKEILGADWVLRQALRMSYIRIAVFICGIGTIRMATFPMMYL